METTSTSPWVIGPVEGFSPTISHLVCMMTWARRLTLDSAEELTVEQLDYLHDASSNSIGALLMHIASVELDYYVQTIEGRQMTAAEEEEWGAALELGVRGRTEIRGYPLEHYVATLDRVRARVLAGLRGLDDRWLFRESPFWDELPGNHYFMWFHSIEDEISHRGQIRWLARRARMIGAK
jgi:uncharacterized damage-inducible protein DinB